MFKIYDGRTEFYQWDLDRKLIVADKAIKQVHFCNRTDECSLICQVYEEDGQRLANVPNILLQDNWRINVYGYDKNYTKHSAVFEVIKRSKPADYVYTETEVLNYSKLDERITALEQGGSADLSNYYTKTETDTAITDAIGKIDIPEADLTGYATEQYVDDKVAAIPQPDLTGYALKSDIPDTTGLATTTYVNDAIANIEVGVTSVNGQTGDIQTRVVVTFSDDGDENMLTFKPSYTSQEIYAAYLRGQRIEAVDSAGTSVYYLTLSTADRAIFEKAVIAANRIQKNTFTITGNTAVMANVKFAPSEYITETELNGKGYQTADQVTALINDALGVIENGTY